MTHWIYSRKKSLGVAEKDFLSPLLTSAGTREQFPTSAETLTQWGNFLGFLLEKVLDTRYPLGNLAKQ